MARATAPLAADQGLYNGFLAAGLAWGLIAADPTGHRAQIFFLACVLVAQALPGAICPRHRPGCVSDHSHAANSSRLHMDCTEPARA
jgi:hypothetical protein